VIAARRREEAVQSHSVRKKTQWMQGAVGRNINDVALISGDVRRQDRGKSYSAGKARAFHLMNAPYRQTAVGHPAIHCIGNWHGARETPLRLFQTIEPLTEFFKGRVGGHSQRSAYHELFVFCSPFGVTDGKNFAVVRWTRLNQKRGGDSLLVPPRFLFDSTSHL
jgi:hypothetical protein